MTLRTKQCWIVFSIKSMCSLDSYCTGTRPCQTFFVPSNRWRSLVSVFFRTIAKKWATDLHVIPRYLYCPDETNRTISNLRSINNLQPNPVVPERVTWLDWFRYSKKDEAWNYEFDKSEFCFQKRLGDLYLARYSKTFKRSRRPFCPVYVEWFYWSLFRLCLIGIWFQTSSNTQTNALDILCYYQGVSVQSPKSAKGMFGNCVN